MDYLTNDTDLTTVADAIREKGGTSAALAFPQGFADAIAAIPSGGGFDLPDGWDYDYGSITPEENVTSHIVIPLEKHVSFSGDYIAFCFCDYSGFDSNIRGTKLFIGGAEKSTISPTGKSALICYINQAAGTFAQTADSSSLGLTDNGLYVVNSANNKLLGGTTYYALVIGKKSA